MKIPFERTIAGAYRFAFTNALSVIGIGWFPFLLVFALGAGLAVLLYPTAHALWLQDGKTFDYAKVVTNVLPLAGGIIVVFIGVIVAQAMVTVGLMRKALGQHPGPVFIFFSLGGQIWRLLGAYILTILLITGGIVLMALGIGAVSLLLGQVAPKAQGAVTVVLSILAVLTYFYSVVRLTFFIPAVVVAENHIGLRRSWHLGRGNFWRIFGISLIVGLPIQMANSTIISTVMQAAGLQGLQQVQPGPMSAAQTAKFFSDLMSAALRIGPFLGILEVVYFALLVGLTTGAVANAYRAVAGDASGDLKAAA